MRPPARISINIFSTNQSSAAKRSLNQGALALLRRRSFCCREIELFALYMRGEINVTYRSFCCREIELHDLYRGGDIKVTYRNPLPKAEDLLRTSIQEKDGHIPKGWHWEMFCHREGI